jgi:hypothetical protein
MSDTSNERSNKDLSIVDLERANASLTAEAERQFRQIALLQKVMQEGWSWAQLTWAQERVESGHVEDVANAEIRSMLVGLAEIPDVTSHGTPA